MTRSNSSHGDSSLAGSTEALRQWAQARFNGSPDPWQRGQASRQAEQLGPDQLQAYQVELELQSEELRRVRAVLGVYRARYLASGAGEGEETLRLHSDILNSLGHGVYLIRVSNGEIVFANPCFERMFGYGAGELLGKHVSIVNAPGQKSPESVAKLIMAELARSGAWEGEVQNVRKDGSVFWSHAKVTSFDHPRYGPVWVSMHDDITGRMGQVPDRDRLRVQRILKLASDGIHIMDTDGLLVEANDAFLAMLGYDESVIGKLRVTDWDAQMSLESFNAEVDDLIKRGSKGPFEATHQCQNGTRLAVEITASPIEIEGKTYIYAASRDITERKRVEDELFQMASTLEQQVNARTSRLREVSAQLAMTEERERRLLAEELHDNLCQLLAVIKIKLTSITAATFESSVGQVVGLVDQADQSARLITRELSPQVLHTLGFVPALVSLAKEKRRAFGITMHIDCDREPALLEDGMRAMLYRSVRELLTNIGKHARVSEAYLFCRIEQSRLRIIVRDHGCGFDPLQYRDASPGLHGFGLTSIYERVTNVGGEMTIDSSPGHGTSITLSVPYSIATGKGQPP
ncbi:MAG: PAS domain S-box protein [Sterolibacterium sp.]|jgi:PAS domain S-box-containing protein